jgi:predicted neuraminidase
MRIANLLTPIVLSTLMICASYMDAQSTGETRKPMVSSEFIYTAAPFQSAHASTIADTPGGLVAAWFGGPREGADDVCIWVSRHVRGAWTEPMTAATGEQADGKRYPCWNPVLFCYPDGALLLFYKVGPSPSRWWGILRESHDSGATWSEARRLPDGILGPVKNKPVLLPKGTLLCPTSAETTERPSKWRVHFELTDDRGKTWRSVAPATGPVGEAEIDAIQPSVLLHPDGKLQAIGRTGHAFKHIFETWSSDNGKTWSPLKLTVLPNPNSGTDAVTLRDGRHLLIYNHTPDSRTPLNLAVSNDGKTWQAVAVIESEPGEYSYPAIIQARDGLVHITYTWKRERIKHVVVDPKMITGSAMPDGVWPVEVAP